MQIQWTLDTEDPIDPNNLLADIQLSEAGIRKAVANRYKIFGDQVALERAVESFCLTHFIALEIRSSGSSKKGLVIGNGIGVLDFDFEDEICLIAYNTTEYDIVIEAGERIAQAMILQHETDMFGYFSNEERIGGFGSSGRF